MVSGMCFSQYSDHQLYQAYLERDMEIWKQYITSADWDNLSVEERRRLLNYEYGFSAYILGQDSEQARIQISRFESHLEAMKTYLPEARYHAYLSSLYTYKLGLDKKHLMKYASGIFDNMKSALALDSNDAFVLSMQGNVEFYSPFGNKKKALDYFLQSDSLYCSEMLEYEKWNLCAVRMTLVQCLIKLGRKEEARQLCEQYLAAEPSFEVIKKLKEECD